VSRRDPKRNRKSGRFAKLPLTVLGHEAVISLTHAQFRVLVLMAAQFNGYNNGALGLSKTQAEKQNITNKTLYKALRILEERGLIERTYPASRVPPRPTMYALTWTPLDDTDWSRATRTPSRTFIEWKAPPKTKRRTVKRRLHAVK
jgi:DNA-binding HxlR family transcriptional regulator